MKEGLGSVDPYFTKLGDAMVTWIEAWRQLNPPAEAESAAEGESATKGATKGANPTAKLANGK